MRTPPRVDRVDPEVRYLAEHVLETEAYNGGADDFRARVLSLAEAIQRAIVDWKEAETRGR